MLPQVLHREDPVGLGEGVLLLQPQGTQLHDGIDVSPQLMQGLHEAAIVQSQVLQYGHHVVVASVDEVENCLAVVLWDILGFTHVGRVHLSRILIFRLVGILLITLGEFLLLGFGFGHFLGSF